MHEISLPICILACMSTTQLINLMISCFLVIFVISLHFSLCFQKM